MSVLSRLKETAKTGTRINREIFGVPSAGVIGGALRGDKSDLAAVGLAAAAVVPTVRYAKTAGRGARVARQAGTEAGWIRRGYWNPNDDSSFQFLFGPGRTPKAFRNRSFEQISQIVKRIPNANNKAVPIYSMDAGINAVGRAYVGGLYRSGRPGGSVKRELTAIGRFARAKGVKLVGFEASGEQYGGSQRHRAMARHRLFNRFIRDQGLENRRSDVLLERNAERKAQDLWRAVNLRGEGGALGGTTNERRLAILEARERGFSRSAIGRAFGVSKNRIKRLEDYGKILESEPQATYKSRLKRLVRAAKQEGGALGNLSDDASGKEVVRRANLRAQRFQMKQKIEQTKTVLGNTPDDELAALRGSPLKMVNKLAEKEQRARSLMRAVGAEPRPRDVMDFHSQMTGGSRLSVGELRRRINRGRNFAEPGIAIPSVKKIVGRSVSKLPLQPKPHPLRLSRN